MNKAELNSYKILIKEVKEVQEEIDEAFLHLNLKIELEKDIETLNKLKSISGILAAQAIYTREIIEDENFLNNDFNLIKETLKNILDTCQSVMGL